MIELLLLLAIAGLMQAARSFTTTLAHGGTELAFGYLLLVAFFAGKVVSRIKLPRLTGYLIAGVVSGPFVLGLVSTDMTGTLKIVSNACDVHPRPDRGWRARSEADPAADAHAARDHGLRRARRGRRAIRAAVLDPAAVPLFAPLTLIQSVAVCGLLGVALSAQSPAVAMALLSEMKADGPLSRLVLATVVVADLVVVIVYSVVAAVAGSVMGGEVDISDTVLEIRVGADGLDGVRRDHRDPDRSVHPDRQSGASLFALLVCVIVAEIGGRIHLDPLVVMLAAGVWLRNFSRADANALLHGFETAELPVYLVFFALAGTKLNLTDLWATLIPVLIIAITRGGVFFMGSRVACKRTGADPVIAKFAWTGLVPQAGLSLALVAVIQKTFPLTFGPAAGVLLLSVVGVNQLVAPVLLRISLIRSGEAGKATKGH